MGERWDRNPVTNVKIYVQWSSRERDVRTETDGKWIDWNIIRRLVYKMMGAQTNEITGIENLGADC